MKDEFRGTTENKYFNLIFRPFTNRKGQFAIEAVLLTTLLLSVFLVLTKELKKRNVVANLVSKPMKQVGNMAGYGTWKEKCVAQGSSRAALSLGKCHPNSIHRSLSSDPK